MVNRGWEGKNLARFSRALTCSTDPEKIEISSVEVTYCFALQKPSPSSGSLSIRKLIRKASEHGQIFSLFRSYMSHEK